MKKISTFLTLLMLFFLGASSLAAADINIYFEKPDSWGTPKLYLYNPEIWKWGDSHEATQIKGNLYEFDIKNVDYDPANSYSYIIFNPGNSEEEDRVEKAGFENGYVYNIDGKTDTPIEDYHVSTDPSFQSALYVTGLADNWYIGSGMMEIPLQGNGVYTRTFTSPADYSGYQEFKISKNYTTDWEEFDNGVIQPADPAKINETQSYTLGFTYGDSHNISVPESKQFTVTVDMANSTIRVDVVPQEISYQSDIYLVGNIQKFQLGDNIINIPHRGNGVYSRTFTNPADFTGAQIFKISKYWADSDDWSTFDSGVFQPLNATLFNKTQGYTFPFADNISIPDCRQFTVTVDMVNSTIRVDISNDANMPLSRDDFNGGKKHYFFVGTRTNDFRLQPEWELTAENGYRITDRLLYPGMFAVAVVDNYDDYIYHRFTMFTNLQDNGNGLVVTKDYHSNIALTDHGNAGCITTEDYQAYRRPYNFVSDGEGSKVTMIFDWNNVDDKANEILLGNPVLVGEIALALDADGNPVSISFNQCTDDKSLVADHRMFAPCGAEIYNADSSVFDPSKGTTWWWNSENQFHQISAWANAWIQYDSNFEPYVDGYGRYLSQTVFQYSSWMKQHPTYFEYPAVEEMKKMPYSSNDIVFVHYSQLDKSDPYYSYYLSKADIPNTRIGDQTQKSEKLPEGQNPWYYDEQLWSFAADGVTPKELESGAYRESSHWEPYVVSDIWLYGEFKIWAGTSGGPRYQSRATVRNDNEEINTDFLWYPDNGGVDLPKNTAGSVNPTYIYDNEDKATVGQMFTVGKHDEFNNYNFQGAPKYFKRVILWYDADKGLSNSVIQFLGRYFAPTITAAKSNEDNKLEYHWTIPIEESANGKATLVNYRISRYIVNEDGEPQFHGYATNEDGSFTTVGELISDMRDRNDFENIHSGIDHTILSTGTYFYKVEANIKDNTNDADRDLARDATSNRVSLVAVGTDTGVDEISVDGEGTPVYYDLRGVRVENPANGTFIEVRSGNARKVVL